MKFIDEVKYPPQLTFSDKYRKIRDMLYNCENPENNQKKSFPADKKLVKEIWRDQRIERRGVKTAAGDRIFIVSPGEWNLGTGPDFKNALININGKETACDVYAGVYPSDIKMSGTASLSKGNSILSIYLWECDPAPGPSKSKSGSGHFLELKNYLDADIDIIKESISPEDYPSSPDVKPGACASRLMQNYPLFDYIAGLAGDERILSKSRSFEKALSSRTLSELVYRGIIDGLGYGPNRENFKLLAQKLPLERIEILAGREIFESKPLRIQAIMFGMAGLIPEIEKTEIYDAETKEYVSKIRKIWKNVREEISPSEILKSGSWKFKLMRPFNFPYRRIAAASFIISKYIDGGLEKIFYSFYNDMREGRFNLKRYYKDLKLNEFKDADFWSYRTTFNSKKLAGPVAYIGEERVALILINCFLPLAAAICKDAREQKNIYGWWIKQPACSLNSITKYTSKKTGFGNTVRAERAQQGLLQIFRDFCDTKKGVCKGCSFRNLSGLPASIYFKY